MLSKSESCLSNKKVTNKVTDNTVVFICTDKQLMYLLKRALNESKLIINIKYSIKTYLECPGGVIVNTDNIHNRVFSLSKSAVICRDIITNSHTKHIFFIDEQIHDKVFSCARVVLSNFEFYSTIYDYINTYYEYPEIKVPKLKIDTIILVLLEYKKIMIESPNQLKVISYNLGLSADKTIELVRHPQIEMASKIRYNPWLCVFSLITL